MPVPPSKQSSPTMGTPALIPQGDHSGKTTMPLGRVFTLVGSRQRAHLHLLSRSISKAHAIIVNDAGNLYIRDAASREHVYVNGQLVKEAELRNGDLIKIGSFTFKLSDPSGKSGHTLPAQASAAMEFAGESVTTPLEGRTWLIGRRPTCDCVLSEMAVSNVHAIIFESRGRYEIRDLGSRTGTFVNGQTIHQQPLEFNDQIRIGDHEFRFVPAAADLAELEHRIGTATLGIQQASLAKTNAARLAVVEPSATHEDTKRVAAASSADLTEIDLNADPDVSGSGDTRAIPAERLADTPRVPLLSSQVIDDEMGLDSHERHLLVGGDLHEEKLTPSGNFVNVEHDEQDEYPIDADLDLIPMEFEPHAAHEESTAATSDALLAWATAIVTPDAAIEAPAVPTTADAPAGPDALTTAEHVEPDSIAEPETAALEAFPEETEAVASPDALTAAEHLHFAPVVEPQKPAAEESSTSQGAESSIEHTESRPADEPFELEPIPTPAAASTEPVSVAVESTPELESLTVAEHAESELMAEDILPAEIVESPVGPDLLTAAEHLNLSPVVDSLSSAPVDAQTISGEPAPELLPHFEPEALTEEELAVSEFSAAPDLLTTAEHWHLAPRVEPQSSASVEGSTVSDEVAPIAEPVMIEAGPLPEVDEPEADANVLTSAEHFEFEPVAELETAWSALLPEVAEPISTEAVGGPDVLTAVEPVEHEPIAEPEATPRDVWPESVEPVANAELPALCDRLEPQPITEPETASVEILPEVTEAAAGPDAVSTSEHFELEPIAEPELAALEVLPEVPEAADDSGALITSEHFELEPIAEHETAALEILPEVSEPVACPDAFTTSEQFELDPIVEPEVAALEATSGMIEVAPGPDALTSTEHFEHQPSNESEVPPMEAAAEIAESITSPDSTMAEDAFELEPIVESETPSLQVSEEFLTELDEPAMDSPSPVEVVESTPDVDLAIPAAGEFLAALDEPEIVVPPPFPAGLVPDTGSAAVGIPNWDAIRAQPENTRISSANAEALAGEMTLSADTFAGGREVLTSTDPTPESAQHLEEQIGDTWAGGYTDLIPQDFLSDAHFGQVVQDFASPAAGALIEHEADQNLIHAAPIALDDATVTDLETTPDDSQTTFLPVESEHQLTADEAAAFTTHPSPDIAELPSHVDPFSGSLTESVHDIDGDDYGLDFSDEPTPALPAVDDPNAIAASQTTDALQFTTHESVAFNVDPHGEFDTTPAELDKPEIPQEQPSFGDLHDDVPNASGLSPAVTESSLKPEDILAYEGLLPNSGGDEMIDQAMAFLKHDEEATGYQDFAFDHFLLQSPEEEQPTEHQNQYSRAMRIDRDEHDAAPRTAETEVAASASKIKPAPAENLSPPQTQSDDVSEDLGLIFDDEIVETVPAAIAPESDEELPVAGAEPIQPASHAPIPSVAIPARKPDAMKVMTARLDLTELDEGLQLTNAASSSAAAIEAIAPSVIEPEVVAPPTCVDEVQSIAEVESQTTDATVVPPSDVPDPEVMPAAIVTPPAPQAVRPEPQRPQSMSAMLGLSRDFGSFLGGTPLSLESAPVRSEPIVAPIKPASALQQEPSGSMQSTRPAAHRPNSLSAMLNTQAQPSRPQVGRPLFGDVPVTTGFVGDATEILKPFNSAAPLTDVEATPTASDQAVTEIAAPVSLPAAVESRADDDMSPGFDPELELPPEEGQKDGNGSSANEEGGLEWEASSEPVAPPSPDIHPEGAKLFDLKPDALDDLSDSLEPITNVTDVIDDKPSPGPSGTPVAGPIAKASAGGGLPVLRSRSRTEEQPCPNASVKKSGGDTEVMVKPKRMSPPPPARSTGRRAASASAQDAAVEHVAEPLIPVIDVFGQPEATRISTVAGPEIPAAGFIPPGSGPGSRRGRPGRAGAKGESPAAPGKKGSRKPAIIESMNAGEDESAEEVDAARLEQEDAIDSADSAKKKGSKKRWRFPFIGLLLLLISAGAGGAAAWFKLPHSADLRGSIRFEKLDQLSGQGRWKFEQAQHQNMGTEEFRQLTRKIYQTASNGLPDDGFLNNQASGDPALHSIIDASRIEGDRLVFDVKGSRDPAGDRQRFRALLKALYSTDLPMLLNVERHAATLDSARTEYARTQQRLLELQKNIQDGQKLQTDFESARATEKDLSDRSAKLEKIWSDAASDAQKFRAGLDALESAPVAQISSANDDPELQHMTARLKQLNDALDSARGSHTVDAHTAAAALDAALDNYQKEIDKAKAATAAGSELSTYLATAQLAATAIHQINTELAEREKVSSKTVSDLHGTIAEKIEAHLKRVWASDPLLAKLKAVQDYHEHQLGAAVSAGLNDDANRIRGEFDVAKAAVATRRDQIALSANYPDEIKSLQKLISDQAEQMAGERARAEQRMGEQFKLLAAAAPAPGTLPDDQQKSMNELFDNLLAVGTARQQLTQASASASGGDVKALEADVTDLKAQIEARRNQLADVVTHTPPAANSAAVLQQRAKLEAAQQAEARAFSDWTRSKTDLAQAQTALDRLQSTQPDLVRDNAEYVALQARHDILKQQLEQEAAFVPVIPVDPDHEDGVQIMRASDNRIAAEIGVGALFLMTAMGLLVRGGGQREASDESIERLQRDEESAPLGRHAATAA